MSTLDVVADIEQAIEEVEILDSTANPATTGAKDLGGTWKLLYSTADSIQGGALGPLFGEVTHELDISTRTQTVIYSLLGGAFKLDWTHEYRVPSTYQWEVPNEDWTPSLFGFRLMAWSFSNEFRSTWELTYTDPDLRIFRSRSGDPRARNGVYVLERVGLTYTEDSDPSPDAKS